MANEMKIRITADASQATTIMKATQANINKIIKDQPGLEKAFANDSSQKNLDAINKNLSNVIGLVERAAQAIHMADPTISEAEAKTKILSATMESLGREYGGAATESMKYLESLKEAISVEQKNISLLIEKTEAQKKYNTSVQEGIAKAVTGSGEYNAMGLSYNVPETYAESYQKLLEEKDNEDRKALLGDWLKAKQEHENAVLEVEKIAQSESYKQYKLSVEKKKAEEEAYYKQIEEDIRKQEALYDSIITKMKEQAENAKTMQNQAFTWSTGAGDTNAMGQAYKPNETYEQMWGRLLDEQDASLTKASKLKKESNETFSSIFKSVFNIDKLIKTTFSVFQFRFIMKAITAVAGLTKVMDESIQAAAQAEQVFSKLNTVFGDTSNAMTKAVSLAGKLGTATSTAASSLSTVGDLLQAQGMYVTQSLETASEWVSQFQDIIAFKDINMSLEEFAQNFMSGAAGNLRNFRTFGSIVRESAVNAELAKRGLDKLTGSELELAKMTIRAEMALAQQKNALGATQREWDTMLSIQRRYEEAIKSMKEVIGDALLPINKWWVDLKTNILEALTATLKYQKLAGTLQGGMRLEQIYTLHPTENTKDQSVWVKAIEDLVSLYKTSGTTDSKKERANVLAFQYGMNEEDLELALKTANLSGAKFTDKFIDGVMSEFRSNTRVIEINEDKTRQKNEILEAASDLDKFLESIMEIDREISFIGDSWYESFVSSFDKVGQGIEGTSSLKESIEKVYEKIIDASLDEIDDVKITTFESLFEGMTETDSLEKQRDALKSLYQIAEATGKFTDKELEKIYEKWDKLGEYIDEIQENEEQKKNVEELSKNFFSSFGEFGTLISSFGSGDMLDLLSTLVQIVAQTEAFTKLSSILTDSILPVLNAFLEPLIPIINQISSIISNLVQTVLVPFYPILKAVAYAVAGLFGIVDATFSAMVSGIKKSMGYMFGWIEDLVNNVLNFFGQNSVNWGIAEWRNEDPQKVFEEKLNKTIDTLDEILGYNMEIADNTSEDDYETYRRLLQAKEITDEQFKRLTHQDVYTTKTVGNGIEYTSGGKQSYVSINSLTVQVPAGMTLEEFLKNLGDYSNGNLPFGVNTISA